MAFETDSWHLNKKFVISTSSSDVLNVMSGSKWFKMIKRMENYNVIREFQTAPSHDPSPLDEAARQKYSHNVSD